MKRYLNKGLALKVVLALVALFLCFKQSPRFDYEDYGVYYHYSKSIVEDNSFNISNELRSIRNQRQEPVILTPTYFDPNFHSHGIAVPYSVIYYISSKVYDYVENGNSFDSTFLNRPWKISSRDLFIQSIMATMSLLLLLVALKFLYNELLKDYSKRCSISSIFFLTLSTSLYIYTIVLPGNANFIAAILGIPLITMVIKNFEGEKNTVRLLFYLACCVIVKVDFVFYLLLVPFLFKNNKKSTVYGCLVGLVLAILLFINKYIQYGALTISYGGVSSEFFILFDILLAPVTGYLFSNPIYIVLTFFLFVTTYGQGGRAQILKALLFIPIVKIVSQGFTFSSGVDFGARGFLVDFALWVFIFCEIFKNNKFKKTFVLLVCLCMVWTVILASLYGNIENKQSYSYVFFHMVEWCKQAHLYTYDYLLGIDLSYVRAGLVSLFGLSYLFIRQRISFTFFITTYSLFFTLIYSGMTYLNFSTSKDQKKLSLKSDIVSSKKSDWYYIETREGIEERIDYLLNSKASQDELEKILKYRSELLNSLKW